MMSAVIDVPDEGTDDMLVGAVEAVLIVSGLVVTFLAILAGFPA